MQTKPERERYLGKMVSNARAILSNQIAIPLGVYKMVQLLSALESHKADEDLDLIIFQEYDLQTDELPVGTERLYWNIDKLIELEMQFDEVNAIYKADILRTCRKIIDVYGDAEQT